MIKRIPTEQLAIGMYIHDINCGWMAHPFLLNQFKITKHSEIDKIIEYGIRTVYIDTSLGIDLPGAPTQEEVHAELDREMVQAARTVVKPVARVALGDELVIARRIWTDAKEVMHDILTDVRFGQQVQMERVEPMVEKMIGSVLRNPGALTSLGRVKEKDAYTFEHSVNVGVLMVNFCNHLGMDPEVVRHAAIGGLLHDVGKMRTPDEVLNKPGRLSDEEFAIMRLHVTEGVEILKQTPGISPISMAIAAQHHEHIDGEGYPARLKGDDISQLGQMAAIVDVYDALTSIRIYHQAMEPTEALRKLYEWSKFHFNGDLVQRYIQCIGIYPVGTLVRLESGLLAIVIEESLSDLLHPKVRAVFDTHRNLPIAPHDIDLASPQAHDRIAGYEPAAKWRINVRQYM